MRGLKKQRRIQVLMLATACLIGASVLIGYGFRDGINFFYPPADVVDNPPPADQTFRIGGLVEPGTLIRGQGATITFNVTDGAASIPVRYTGVLPDLFNEGEGMVGTGRLIDGVIEATEILARHDETYMPKEVIDALKEQGMYQAPES